MGVPVERGGSLGTFAAMRLNPLVAVVAACALTLTACGGDGDKDEKSEKDKASASPSETATAKPLEFDDSEKKLPPKKVCQALDAADVGEALGDEVKRGPVVQGTCTFADLRMNSERSVGISYLQLSGIGGVDGYEAGLGGEPVVIDDLGDKAFVLVSPGSNGATAIAALATGDALIQLQVIPGIGVSETDAETVATNLLRLVAARV